MASETTWLERQHFRNEIIAGIGKTQNSPKTLYTIVIIVANQRALESNWWIENERGRRTKKIYVFELGGPAV